MQRLNKFIASSGFCSRRKADEYIENGDVVVNNTAFYVIKNYSGELKWDSESKDMKFFALDDIPENLNDPDLVEIYKTYTKKKK